METRPALQFGAPEREQQFETARQQRREQAWALARKAAALLKEQYQATRVVAFGSLPDQDRFHPWSDVDLAAWGLRPGRYFEAVASLLDLGSDIRIDLVMAERCKTSVRAAIEAGLDL